MVQLSPLILWQWTLTGHTSMDGFPKRDFNLRSADAPPRMSDEEESFPGYDDPEICQADQCRNEASSLCAPCRKHFCSFHLPVQQHDHDVQRNSSKYCEDKVCERKLPLTAFPCHCGGYYCGVHMPSDKHGCDYDYQKAQRDRLTRDLEKVDGEKIRKI